MSNILGIGKSALNAAQFAIDTTGHNIANAATPGYSREIVQQAANAGQDLGFGFVGKGTQIVGIQRVYNEFTTNQLRSTQSNLSQLDTYYTQIQQVNNMLADSTTGLSPTLQSFFSSIQDLASSPSSMVSRQSLLSSSQALVSQFNSMGQQIAEINQGVNAQLSASTTAVNAYATEIAKLNDEISKAMGVSASATPNDLLDQRDQVLANLSKEVRVTVVKQNNAYDVYIGNGQPLVVGPTNYKLSIEKSLTDPTRAEVAYLNSDGSKTILSENNLSGGNLSGLLEFRSKTLDVAQNSLGRIATVLASTINAQQALGQDLNGASGGDLFNVVAPVVAASANNTSSAAVTAAIGDPTLLTTSDYRLSYDGTNYTLLRLSDSTVLSNTDMASAQNAAATQGFTFGMSATQPNAGDMFIIKPTANGASRLSMAITDGAKIAAAAPMIASASTANVGTGAVSQGVVSSIPTNANATLTYTAGNISGFPAGEAIIQTVDGVSTTYAAGSSVPYTEGATLSYGGISISITGVPGDGDQFIVVPNTSGVGDNRNALLMGALQTTGLMDGGTTTYQGAYSQLINMIGNKTSELQVTSQAAQTQYTSAYNTKQAESGVNLDEEAANLIRYQQAYQAAARVMQIAGDLFDTLLSIGQ